MSHPDEPPHPDVPEPLLAPLLRAPVTTTAVAGLLVIAIASAIIWFAMPGQSARTTHIPASPADLSERIITPIDPDDPAAVAAATATLRLPESQRLQIQQAVLARQRRLAWIVFTDSMDPDGDEIAVEASGIVQHVVLSKAWVPVVVPIEAAGPIRVTAVRDGGGGGITVAIATRGGAVALRVMLPGERIEVMP